MGDETDKAPGKEGPATNVEKPFLTTRQIQQKLEENSMLLEAINERQNVNSLKECAQYQAKLEANLRELASLLEKN
jgi:hypothetical protein